MLELEINHENIVLPGVKMMRIVAISDLHFPCKYSLKLDFINSINNYEPDICVIAGDTIDKKGNEFHILSLGRIQVKLAKFATLGNWEYKAHLDLIALKNEYEKAGVQLLINDFVAVNNLIIIGLDDYVKGSPDYKILEEKSNRKHPILLISHCPETFDSIPIFQQTKIIMISGHTHGGQIAPCGYVLHTPKGSGQYKHGWYHRANNCMYVMRGIGTIDIPLRIGAKPEILVLDIN